MSDAQAEITISISGLARESSSLVWNLAQKLTAEGHLVIRRTAYEQRTLCPRRKFGYGQRPLLEGCYLVAVVIAEPPKPSDRGEGQ